MSKANRRLGGKRRRSRRRNGPTYDGVTDRQILERDGYECQMPACLHPDGRAILPDLLPDDPWRASIDHVVQVADGGADNAANKRAAHAECNVAAARRRQRPA